MDLHTDTNNFAPNEYREVVNPSGLVVYKGSMQVIIVIGIDAIVSKNGK